MATIPNVGDNELVRTSWGNAVADELNIRTIKNNVSGQTLTGSLIINGNPALRLKRAGELPFLQFESVAGTRFGYIQGFNGGMSFLIDAASGLFRWFDNAVGTPSQLMALDSSGLTVAGALSLAGALDLSGFNVTARAGIFARGDGAQQLVIASTETAAGTNGVGAHAFITFYPDATNDTTFGARGGYIGFNGEGMQVSAEIGAVSISPADALYVGKSASSQAVVGTELFTSTAAAGVRGSIWNTVNDANTWNMELRRGTTAASADGQIFIEFQNSAGTRVGRIEMVGTTGSAMVSGSDYRLKDDYGPITDAVERVRLLQPKRLRFKADPPDAVFDGFIAHEVTPAAPYAVRGEKDAVLPADDPNDPGGIDPQGLMPDKLVSLLTAALQAALDKIDDLEARVATLEAAA